jgi:hypothetical protein
MYARRPDGGLASATPVGGWPTIRDPTGGGLVNFSDPGFLTFAGAKGIYQQEWCGWHECVSPKRRLGTILRVADDPSGNPNRSFQYAVVGPE